MGEEGGGDFFLGGLVLLEMKMARVVFPWRWSDGLE